VGSAKAGLNIMMSLTGRRQTVSFIEDCAGRTTSGDYTAALTDVFTRHGTPWHHMPIASSALCMCAPILDMPRICGTYHRAACPGFGGAHANGQPKHEGHTGAMGAMTREHVGQRPRVVRQMFQRHGRNLR